MLSGASHPQPSVITSCRQLIGHRVIFCELLVPVYAPPRYLMMERGKKLLHFLSGTRQPGLFSGRNEALGIIEAYPIADGDQE